jgi:SAM-dependent methyltransferase
MSMLKAVTGVSRQLVNLFRRKPAVAEVGLAYWQQRAAQFGRRAVLNLEHPESQFQIVTDWQTHEILPFLEELLNGDEKVALDFGCGPGRFTAAVATSINGRSIGVDPIARFIDLAPKAANVDYTVITEGILPLKDESVDVVWICLVLGGLVAPELLSRSLAEVGRVLKPQGLLFVVENTSEKPDCGHWCYRSVPQYQSMFPFADLVHLHDYFDLDERIAILAGRKRNASQLVSNV